MFGIWFLFFVDKLVDFLGVECKFDCLVLFHCYDDWANQLSIRTFI